MRKVTARRYRRSAVAAGLAAAVAVAFVLAPVAAPQVFAQAPAAVAPAGDASAFDPTIVARRRQTPRRRQAAAAVRDLAGSIGPSMTSVACPACEASVRFASAHCAAAVALTGPVHLAHADLSGFSLFEEALEWGTRAAARVVARLTRTP